MMKVDMKGTKGLVFSGLLALSLLQGDLVFASSIDLGKQNSEQMAEEVIEAKKNVRTEKQIQMPVQQNLQKAVVNNNDVIFVTISQKELTRFVFEGDKIKHIYAISGELSYDMVDENLYLKPNLVKPINFFVTTEKGKTYQILAEPRDIPATQVMVIGVAHHRNNKTVNGSTTSTSQSFKVSTYVMEGENGLVKDSMSSDAVLMKEIRKVVLAIKSNDRTLGFNIKDIDKEKRERDGIVEYIASRWSNEDIIAEKYHLANVTNENITLNKANYLAEDIVGVYLDKPSLAPSESTLLILLRSAR
jgi:hypothetical protein